MQKVRCYECGKRYDFDVDDFCPRCGAFTLPTQKTAEKQQSAAMQTDGTRGRSSGLHAKRQKEHGESEGVSLKAASGQKAQKPFAQKLYDLNPAKQDGRNPPGMELFDTINDWVEKALELVHDWDHT